MSFISMKIIKGKKQFYLEKSIRLPNNKIKKISVYLKGYDPKKVYEEINEYEEILSQKAIQIKTDSIAESYRKNHVFTKELISKLENIKIDYQKILTKLTENQINDIIDRFTVNFTYESNAIEGNSLTLKDVTFIIKEGKAVSGKDLREVYETINTRKAFAWIFEDKPKINEDNIINIHEILIKDTGVALGYKKLPNFLLGRNVKTTPPEKVKEEVNALISWYNNAKDIHPLQLAAEFHGKFERIHPFEDGNGRVGRILINTILMNSGYPPIIIRKSQRIAYFDALDAFDNGHADKLHRFLIDKCKKTFDNFFKVYVKYI